MAAGDRGAGDARRTGARRRTTVTCDSMTYATTSLPASALIPRFRQRLVRAPFGLGWPYWLDDPTFDISFHVNVAHVDAPGDEAQVLRACERLRRVAFDPARPLWSMWFLTGLPEGRIGWYVRVHHSIADGVAGVALLATFLDGEPAAAEKPGSWQSQPRPTVRSSSRTTSAGGVGRHDEASRRCRTRSRPDAVCCGRGRRCVRPSPKPAPRRPASTGRSAPVDMRRHSACRSTT